MERTTEKLLDFYKANQAKMCEETKSLINEAIIGNIMKEREKCNKIEFEVLGKPQGKERPRVVHKNSRVIAFTPQKTMDYEELVKWEYLSKYGRNDAIKTAVKMEIIAVFGIPKKTSKKKRAEMLEGLTLPTVKPDADNIGKVIMDALNGLAYEDDNQVVSLDVKKVYGEIPKVRIVINEIRG